MVSCLPSESPAFRRIIVRSLTPRDLASYQEAIASLNVPILNDRFDMLRQLGNSFIVQPNVLKSYLTEGHLGRIDTRLLRPYLMQRSDWGSFNRTLVLDDGLPVDVPDPSAPAATSNSVPGMNALSSVPGNAKNMFRGSRLSAMSGVAGTGMGKLKQMLKELDAMGPEDTMASRNVYSSSHVPPMYFRAF